MLNPITHYHPLGYTHPRTVNLREMFILCGNQPLYLVYIYPEKEINADWSYQTGSPRYVGGADISAHALKE